MLHEISNSNHRIDSVHVIRNGYLVLDSYQYPFAPGMRHIIHSCTKSIVSALVGIAINNGNLKGVRQNVFDIFGDPSVENPSNAKSKLRLENLLTMTTGLESRDSYLYRWEGLSSMRRSDDWVVHALGFPSIASPGRRFDYSNTASFLLSAAIDTSTGMSTADFATRHLFEPLGFDAVVWPENPDGISLGWGELRMHPLDLAKIGMLYLYNGLWDDNQIIPSSWIESSTRSHIQANTLRENYGYQWWIHPSGTFMALGYAGQYLIVSPDLELVVVFTSALSEQDFYLPWRFYENYVVPAVVDSSPLPPDQNSHDRLGNAVTSLADGSSAANVQRETGDAIQEREHSITNRRIGFERNPFGLSGMTFHFQANTDDPVEPTVREHYTARTLDYRIGQNGRYAQTDDGSLEPVAVRGFWVNTNQYALEYRSVGGAWNTDMVFTFDEDRVSVTAQTGSQSDITFSGLFE